MKSNVFELSSQKFDYACVENRMQSMGYQIPSVDKADLRQKQAWEYLKQKNISLEITQINHEIINEFSTNTGEYHETFQSRMNENKEKKKEIYQEIFKCGKKLKRLPFVMKVDDMYYVAIGNHRIGAFKIGYSKDPKSPVTDHFLLIDPDDNLTLEQKLDVGEYLADTSNATTGDETIPETQADIIQQIKRSYERKKRSETIKDYAEKFLNDRKPKLSKTTKTKILNLLDEKSDSYQSIEFPETKELDTYWSSFFLNCNWNPDKNDRQFTYFTNKTNFHFKSLSSSRWLTRATHSLHRDRMQLCIRVGDKKNENINKTSTIKKGRVDWLGHIESWNNNKNFESSGYPLYTKIMFVKQTQDTDYEAHQWCDDNNKFFPVKKTR